MFNSEFFPTPQPVIAQMAAKIKKWGTPILDPSAGKGDLLDEIKNTHKRYYRKSDFYAIEIEPELRSILQGKGYTVIGTDFLTYSEPTTFPVIVMNPPFSNGSTHVMRAWQVLRDGGELVAIVNAQTLKNPHTKERQNLLELISQHGEWESIGQAFKTAERPTDVEVALIYLKKLKQDESKIFEDLNLKQDHLEKEEEINPSMLAYNDAIKDLVSRYNASVSILQARNKQQKLLDLYMKGVSSPVYQTSDKDQRESLENKYDLNEQLLVLKSRFWATVFSKTRIAEITTSKMQERFQEFSQQNATMAFTEENIISILEMFFLNRHEIMKECLIHTFDRITQYHEKNIIHNEGWKTNKSYKIAKKIIHPYAVEWSWGSFKLNYRSDDLLKDLDKCCCYLSGKDIGNIKTVRDSISEFCHRSDEVSQDLTDKFSSEFFDIRVYKKGTVHLYFKDEKVWADFNRTVAEGKNWLGADH